MAAISEVFGSQLQLLRCHYSMPPRGSAASSRVLHCSFFTGASGYAFGYASGCASVYRHLVAVDFTADASYTMTLGTAGADWPGLTISIIMIFSIMIFVTMTRWLLVTCCGGCSQRVFGSQLQRLPLLPRAVDQLPVTQDQSLSGIPTTFQPRIISPGWFSRRHFVGGIFWLLISAGLCQ